MCRVCADERQYVGWGGQKWTTGPELRAAGHINRIEQVEPGLWGIDTEPGFAIGQRSLLVINPAGNVLWDCISLVDDKTIGRIEALGGLAAVSASHPHFYGSMVEWSDAAGGVPIYLPEADREWVCRSSVNFEYYRDSAEPVAGIRLIRCGGHFSGSAVLFWPGGAGGRGALLTGDTLAVAMDRRFLSFMWSYPNSIPLDAGTVDNIVAAVDPLEFDRIHGGWGGRTIETGAKRAVTESARRYIARIKGPQPTLDATRPAEVGGAEVGGAEVGGQT